MLWKFLRIILGTYAFYYFRKFKGEGLHKIRVKGPVLIAINHPNAFVDPILLSLTLFNPRTYYMARGDAFKKGIISKFLTAIGIIPIFRMRDAGIEGVKKNNESFSIAYGMWNKNQKIMVFPEGLCVQERRLRPIQKGTARMAFGFSEQYKRTDMLIVPVCVTYSHPSKMDTDVFYEAGEPIAVKEYIDLYIQNPAKAVNDLTKQLEERMRVITPHLNNPDNDALIEQLQEIYKEQYLEDNKLNNKDLKEHQKFWFYITNQLNGIEKDSLEIITHLRQLCYQYVSHLKIHKLRDEDFYLKSKDKSRSSFVLLITLLLLFPFYLAGKILNFIPKYAAKAMADKTVKNIEFYASIHFGAGAVFAFLFMLIELSVLWFVFKIWWYLPIYFVLKLAFGAIAKVYSRFSKKAIASVRFNVLVNKQPNFIKERSAERTEILRILTGKIQ